MELTEKELIRHMSQPDVEAIVKAWQWLFGDKMAGIVMATSLGDLFLLGADEAVYWLQTDLGELSKVADNLTHFQALLQDEATVDKWLLPQFVRKLIESGRILPDGQVYSYITPPIVGGAYSLENIGARSVQDHFAFMGTVHKELKDVPAGTRLTVEIKPTDGTSKENAEI